MNNSTSIRICDYVNENASALRHELFMMALIRLRNRVDNDTYAHDIAEEAATNTLLFGQEDRETRPTEAEVKYRIRKTLDYKLKTSHRDYFRKREALAESDLHSDIAETPRQSWTAKHELVARLVDELEPELREVVVLTYYEQVKKVALAKRLGKTRSQIYTLLRRATAELEKLMLLHANEAQHNREE